MKTKIVLMCVVLYGLLMCQATDVLAQAKPLPTLWIIGDSTVKNHTKGLEGWGDPIKSFFDPTKITVENCALGGRSSRTFLTEGLWDKVAAQIKPGDFVLMQFGHNDGGSIRTSYRASLKGIGEETQTATDPRLPQPPDPKAGTPEIVHSYGWYLRKYVEDSKAKGATPIVLSLIPRDIWSADNKVARSTKDYGVWAAQIANAEGVPFIDLNAITADKYDALGPEKVKAQYFPGDHTHTNPAGARVNAESVVEGIRGLKNCSLAADLLPSSLSVPMDASESAKP